MARNGGSVVRHCQESLNLSVSSPSNSANDFVIEESYKLTMCIPEVP